MTSKTHTPEPHPAPSKQELTEVQAQLQQNKNALSVCQAQKSLLECNIVALRKQRADAVDREAEALIALEQEKIGNIANVDQAKQIITQHQNDLLEVRTKFGELKHEYKQIQSRSDDISAQYGELQSAVNWYLANVKGDNDQPLLLTIRDGADKIVTVEDILAAYRISDTHVDDVTIEVQPAPGDSISDTTLAKPQEPLNTPSIENTYTEDEDDAPTVDEKTVKQYNKRLKKKRSVSSN